MQRAVCCSHIGGRSNQEDNFLFFHHYLQEAQQRQMPEERSLRFTADACLLPAYFAISDGMGGHHAGEVASRTCVQALSSLSPAFQKCGSLRRAVALFQTAVGNINTDVCEMGRRQPDLYGMGATLVVLILYGGEAAILNIGDSRAYFFDGDALIQLTKDHTEGQRMLDLGLLTRKELADFPARKHLSRYIGYDRLDFVLQADEFYPPPKPGVFLLCSDGLSDALSDNRIRETLLQAQDLGAAGERLVAAAASTDCADNITAMLIPFWR